MSESPHGQDRADLASPNSPDSGTVLVFGRRVDLWQVALWGIVVAACVLPLWSALLGRTHLFSGDLTLAHAPWNEEFVEDRTGTAPTSDFVDWQIGYQESARQRAWDGDLAEWDDYSGAGAPLVALPHTGMYSPLGWVTWVVPADYAAGLLKLLEFAASIGGMFLFTRVIGLSSSASVIAGVVYAFNGFQIVWSTNQQTFTAALIPWVFWAAERLIRRRRWPDVVVVAVTTAAMALGGFLAVAAYALYAAAFYLVSRTAVVSVRNRRAGVFRRPGAARDFVLHQIGDGLRWGVGVVTGVAVIAVLMVPFYRVLSSGVLDDRGHLGLKLPDMLLTTLAFPHSYGVLNQTDWFGPYNPVEGVGYVGAGSLVLALFGVVVVRWRSELSIVVIPAVITLGIFVLVAYTDLPFFADLADLPGIANSPRGRMRSVNAFFIAVLAGIGADVAIRRTHAIQRWERLVTVGLASVGIVGVLAFLRHYAGSRGQWDAIAGWLMVDVAAATMIGLVVVSRRAARRPRGASVILTAVVCIEALFFVVPYFPRTDPAVSMQETAAHRFLRDNMDENDREVSHRFDLFPGTTKYYRIRSVTGHFWHPTEWQEFLEALDPTAFDASHTFSTLDLSTKSRIASPLLDRAAARYAVVNPSVPIYGRPGSDHPLETAPDASRLRAVILDGHIRGMAITVPEEFQTLPAGVPKADLHIELRSPDGTSLGTAKRRFWGSLPGGELSVPFAGEHLDPARYEVLVWLENAISGETLEFHAESVRPVVAADDGLRLDHVSGVAIWERTTALDRYRWAETAVVEPDGPRRLDQLASGAVAPTEVVLNAPTERIGGPGTVTSIEATDPDHRTIEVESSQGGWLVVADTMQAGWSATIDGDSADLEPADHAFVAVYVPAGKHDVVLDYQAPGTSTGRTISVVTVAALAGAGIIGFRRRRLTGD